MEIYEYYAADLALDSVFFGELEHRGDMFMMTCVALQVGC